MIDKNKKDVWVFHHYATPPTLNGFSRPFNFAINTMNYFNTTIFSASYLHFSDQNLIKDNKLFIVKEDSKIPFVFINTPSSSGSSLNRLKNMYLYYKRLFKVTRKHAKTAGKPHAIIASSPHPLTMIAGIKIAKKLKVPCICEIRDLWPEAIFSFGKLNEKSFLGRILTNGEYWIYKNADALIFLKEGDVDYLLERKWNTEQGGKIDSSKCFYINNGVDLELFDQQKKENILVDPDLEGTSFKVIYTGAIRPINNVGNIIDAAKLIQDKNIKNIEFLIYGEGSQLEELKRRVERENIVNVKLKGYVDKKYIPYILSRSSVNILNYSQSKYNWSRGNSSNKLFEYLASGKPIISTVKMGYCPLEKNNCGISLEEDTPTELAKKIIEFYSMDRKEYLEMGLNAKKAAVNFDFKKLSEDYRELLYNYIKE